MVNAFDVSGFRWPMPPPEKLMADEPARRLGVADQGLDGRVARPGAEAAARAIDLLGETRCCGPPLLSDPPFILADEVGSYSLHRTSYLPRR